eukprot:TRINITY_DN1136_c0_g1_i1.p1 TRINITY_DN1136_c0_g1~~TRINITY_DN1136_c0_g1_i1.p1  ORF type:complete len:450 (-),score=186.59 TRINITY_DN1136_c0_g1_i1:134-1483(-)
MAEKAGFLTKEGGSYRSWKRRWCVLKNGELNYSKSQKGSSLGSIDLHSAGAIEVTSSRPSKRNCFHITTPKRDYFVCADTESERDSWIKELCMERDRCQGKLAVAPAAAASTPAVAKSNKVVLEDFEMLLLIGKGSFGKVVQVRKKDTCKIYAMKILNKDMILERQELEHAKAEKSVLQKLVHPFLVNLNYSFQTPDKLYLVMDFVNGGELFFHLQKDKRFSEERARFYLAEILCGLEYLHANGVIYRDLKPENLLLTSDGHICMTDFGLAKEGLVCDDARTQTFCGTPEYLAPEVLNGEDYGKAVDWWSYGTLMYEMLSGLPPFYCEDVQKMYQKIINAPLEFSSIFTPASRSLLQGLLERSPEKRLADPKMIRAHLWYESIDWEKLESKEILPPFIPPVKDELSVNLIDQSFLKEAGHSHTEKSSIGDALNIEGFTYMGPQTLSNMS